MVRARVTALRVTCVLGGLTLVALSAWELPALAAASDPPLGRADSFAVLATSTVTNTGPSVVMGDVGLSPGTAVTGFPPATVSGGSLQVSTAAAAGAVADAQAASADLATQATTGGITADLAGQTLVPGVYDGATLALSGQLTLDGQNSPTSTFILRSSSTLTTASASSIRLVNGAQACHVFWQIGSSATLAPGSDFIGTLLADTSVTVQTAATVEGRLLALDGAVTLDSDDITRPVCAPATSGVGALPTASASVTATPGSSATPGATATPSPAASTTPSAAPTTSATPSTSAAPSASVAPGPSIAAGPAASPSQPPTLPTLPTPPVVTEAAGGSPTPANTPTATSGSPQSSRSVAAGTSQAATASTGSSTASGDAAATNVDSTATGAGTTAGSGTGQLAYTGADVTWLLALGAFLTALGAAMIRLARAPR